MIIGMNPVFRPFIDSEMISRPRFKKLCVVNIALVPTLSAKLCKPSSCTPLYIISDAQYDDVQLYVLISRLDSLVIPRQVLCIVNRA